MSDRYAIQITTCAHAQYNQLSQKLQLLALRKLFELSDLASRVPPPSKETLRETGIDPPVLRALSWPLMVVYEADPEHHALTVLHVLVVPGARPSPEEKRYQAAAAG